VYPDASSAPALLARPRFAAGAPGAMASRVQLVRLAPGLPAAHCADQGRL